MRAFSILTTSAAAAALLALGACSSPEQRETTHGGNMADDGQASAGQAKPAQKPAYWFKIGDVDAIALADGENPVPNDNKIFGVGQTPEAVANVLTANGEPGDTLRLEVHPLLVRADGRTVLFDAGLGQSQGGTLMQSLQAANVDPASITDVLISHGHGDHTGGLVLDGALAFPNAAIRMSEAEWAAVRANPEMAELVRVITSKVQTFKPDDEILPFVEAQDTAGHTPGHTSYLITSGPNHLLYTGDLMHHFLVSVEHPEWNMGYDADQNAGRERREKEVSALLASGAHIYAYHFPFPGVGRLQQRGGRAIFVPEAQSVPQGGNGMATPTRSIGGAPQGG